MKRRDFLRNGLALGCSSAAFPLITPVAYAAAPWDTRVVVIVLRGAMDGLGAIQPYGDAELGWLRPSMGFGPENGATDLDGFFALNAGFERLYPLWQAGEFGAVHAVSTPYRDKRSHFDGQDLLEAGLPDLSAGGLRDGWLNRLLQLVPGATADVAYAVGRDPLLILSGDADVSRWSPEAQLRLSPQARLLLNVVYHDDPIFRDASDAAIEIADSLALEAASDEEFDSMMMDDAMLEGVKLNAESVKLAEFAANRLRDEARIASFSIGGWDTHVRQDLMFSRAARSLTDAILTLKAGLGPVWEKTAVLCMTEFGRTAQENGTAGTDHGTGTALLYAGGAMRGGRVLGDWPGLDEASLYARRDLMPTRDIRALAAWVLRDVTGIDRSAFETTIFPQLDMGSNPGLML